MRRLLVIGCGLCLGATGALGAEDALDRLDEALAWSSAQGQVRARASGLLDLEGYWFDRPAPGLLRTDDDALFNPRLTLFLDAQLGAKVYFFAQARLDRGFDPGKGPLRGRLDEYALRFTPWRDGRFNFQAGKFATVVGRWVARHHSWENPFITAPLPYESPTGIHYANAATSTATLLRWTHVIPLPTGAKEPFDQYRVPILWDASYASGAAVSGVLGRFDYALEVKNTALSGRPAAWDAAHTQWQHPAIGGRIGYRPNASWQFGLSASTGSYLEATAAPTVPREYSLDDYREEVWAVDAAYAWHHWQVWAEFFAADFTIPEVGRVGLVSYFLEAKYKFTPQLAGAIRWSQQLHDDIIDSAGHAAPWGPDIRRLDLAPSYRFTPHTELKLQYSLQHGGIGPRRTSRLLAIQFILRL